MAQSLQQAVIKVATENPETRKYLVPLLRKIATDFPSEEALQKYLKEHPDADKANHKVVEKGTKGPSEHEAPGKSRAKVLYKGLRKALPDLPYPERDRVQNLLEKVLDKNTEGSLAKALYKGLQKALPDLSYPERDRIQKALEKVL